MKNVILTRGIKLSDTGGKPLDRSTLGRVVETVATDIENMDGRLADIESKPTVTDLGFGNSTMDVTGKSDGLCTFEEGGERKLAVIFRGKLYPLERAV